MAKGSANLRSRSPADLNQNHSRNHKDFDNSNLKNILLDPYRSLGKSKAISFSKSIKGK